jgi:predicted Zn-dependent protease
MRSATCLVAAVAIALSAAPAQADQFKPSKGQQVKLGTQAADEIRRKQQVLPDSDPRVRLVRKIGNRLLGTVDMKGLPWKFSFDVIQSKEVNAFALPGGPTFVYTGLLDKLESEDELAGVMGHEMTHVLKEHWAAQYAATQKRELGIGILLGVLHANSAFQNLGSLVDVMEATKYSRKEESQADAGGFDKMVGAGYNPEGMADVFRMFAKTSSGGQSVPFLADHPSDKSRISRIESMIQASHQNFPPQRPLMYRAQ